jgi:hypothetical protein
LPGACQIISTPAVRRSDVQGGVVPNVNASVATKAVPPAVIVKFTFVEVNATPTVPVPIAPEIEPATLNAVALVNVTVITSAMLADPPISPEIRPFPVPT